MCWRAVPQTVPRAGTGGAPSFPSRMATALVGKGKLFCRGPARRERQGDCANAVTGAEQFLQSQNGKQNAPARRTQ